MIKLNVKVVEINHAPKEKKHDYDLIVEDLNTSNSQIWLQVRRTQAPLIDDIEVGQNVAVRFHAEFENQTANNRRTYKHNNLILRGIKRISIENEFEDYSDDSLIQEAERRGLQKKINPTVIHQNNTAHMKGEFQRNAVENPANIDLFINHSNLLTWEQWNHIFKEVARKPFAERRKMKRDLSLVLNETIS